jgi:hypothetical protein
MKGLWGIKIFLKLMKVTNLATSNQMTLLSGHPALTQASGFLSFLNIFLGSQPGVYCH